MTTPATRPATQSNDRVDRFLAEVGELQQDNGSKDARGAKLGLGLMITGVVVAVIALLLSQLTDNFLNQMTDLSLGLAGLTLALVGSALFLRHSLAQFLRFWLLRMIFEQESGRSGR